MPRTAKAALDATPADVHAHKRESLKRSQSAASIASLPTPPRTRKRKRSRSRHSRATDSGSELDLEDSDDEEIERGRALHGKAAIASEHNRRKLLRLDAIAAELSGQAAEDAFWMGESTVTEIEAARLKGKGAAKDSKESKESKASPSKESPGVRTRSQTRSPSSSPVQMLKRTQTGLLSPPKSHRRRSPRKPAFPSMPTIEENPKTPPAKNALSSVKKKLFPERDSPNNPFLVSEGSAGTSAGSSGSGAGAAVPRTPRKPQYVERPTLTYVLYVLFSFLTVISCSLYAYSRGVRQEFENPLYDPRYPETGVAPSAGPDSPSNLPPEDPEFSPREYCPPRVLFPEARAARRKRRTEADDGPAELVLPQTPTRVKGKAKAKNVRVQPQPKRQKSEWDTSDEEEEPELPSTPKPKTPKIPVRTKAAPPTVAATKPPSRRRTSVKVTEVVVEAPRTRSRTRAASMSAGPVLPEKDRSDAARRAFGPPGRK